MQYEMKCNTVLKLENKHVEHCTHTNTLKNWKICVDKHFRSLLVYDIEDFVNRMFLKFTHSVSNGETHE